MITRASQSGSVVYESSMVDVIAKVLDIAEPGDVIMTLGAGDVNSLAPVIVQALEERYA